METGPGAILPSAAILRLAVTVPLGVVATVGGSAVTSMAATGGVVKFG